MQARVKQCGVCHRVETPARRLGNNDLWQCGHGSCPHRGHGLAEWGRGAHTSTDDEEQQVANQLDALWGKESSK